LQVFYNELIFVVWFKGETERRHCQMLRGQCSMQRWRVSQRRKMPPTNWHFGQPRNCKFSIIVFGQN